MDKYDLTDAVRFALSGKPIEFETAIRQDLAGRLQDAVEIKRDEMRQNMFRVPEDIDLEDNTEEGTDSKDQVDEE